MKIQIKILCVLLLLNLIGCTKESILDPNGTFTDSRDNHVYRWVKIGDQFWMAENLAYLPSVHPSSDTLDNLPHCYVYSYEGDSTKDAIENANFATYGVLYNWDAAQKACPSGWNLPTDKEWKVLEKSLGMSESNLDKTEWRFSGDVGDKMKEVGKE
jgi:uncharacterized protein (TIGR02145 family)